MSKDPDNSKAEQGDSACQSVQSIGEIDGIGDAHERKRSHWNRDIIRQRLKPPKRNVPNHYPAVQNNDKHGDDLAQKLEAVIDSLEVIPEAKKQNDRNAAQKSHHP